MRQISLLLILILSQTAACSMAPILGNKVHSDGLVDGVYNGKYYSFPNSARVRVVVARRRIENVELLSHGASWIGKRASIITQSIIDNQSTDVDVVTGATNSSRVIMNAVHNALAMTGHNGLPPSDSPAE